MFLNIMMNKAGNTCHLSASQVYLNMWSHKPKPLVSASIQLFQLIKVVHEQSGKVEYIRARKAAWNR